MKVFALAEGMFSVGNSKVFEPFDATIDRLVDRERGSFLLTVQPFLVIMGEEVVLLDTGLGASDGGILQLVKNINQLGYQVEQVTRVLLSHLHRDHVGGIFQSVEPEAKLTFPNAIHYFQKRELEYALEQRHASYNLEVLNKIAASDQFVRMTEDSGFINTGISFEVTGGHTPYHQVFWFKEADEILFYGADEAPQLFFVKHKMIGKYDFDGRKTRALRADFLTRATAENWTFLFYHDPEFPLWKPNVMSL